MFSLFGVIDETLWEAFVWPDYESLWMFVYANGVLELVGFVWKWSHPAELSPARCGRSNIECHIANVTITIHINSNNSLFTFIYRFLKCNGASFRSRTATFPRSNPAREWSVTQAWAERCLDEFFIQGDQDTQRPFRVHLTDVFCHSLLSFRDLCFVLFSLTWRLLLLQHAVYRL